jgi:hypothetical protein
MAAGHRFAALAFTPAVKEAQAARGSRSAYERIESGPTHHDALGPEEIAFIGERDSCYIASVSETGWPYVQHRGGPAGFVRAVDGHSLAFPDFRGNRQFVTTGNLRGNDRVALLFMDYPNRLRLKVLGHARVLDAADSTDLAAALALPGYRARIERLFVVQVAAFDWNCPQHITPRYTAEEFAQRSA